MNVDRAHHRPQTLVSVSMNCRPCCMYHRVVCIKYRMHLCLMYAQNMLAHPLRCGKLHVYMRVRVQTKTHATNTQSLNWLWQSYIHSIQVYAHARARISPISLLHASMVWTVLCACKHGLDRAVCMQAWFGPCCVQF